MDTVPGNSASDVEDQKENINNNDNHLDTMFGQDDEFIDNLPNKSLMQDEASHTELSQRTAPELMRMHQKYLKE